MNVIELKKSNLKNKYYSKNFKRCIGTGRLGLALRKDYLDALQLIQKEIGYILFNSKTTEYNAFFNNICCVLFND